MSWSWLSAKAALVSGWLPGTVLLSFVAAFALPSEPSYALVFYLTVLPCLLARLLVTRRLPLTRPEHWVTAALIVWSALTLLWGIDDGHRRGRFLADSVATLGLVLALLAVLPDPGFRRRLGTVLIGAGALNAAFSADLNAIVHTVYPRLRGWGVTHHEILGAAVMTVPALTALARALADRAPWRERAACLGAFAVMAAFILMTESRGPLLAACAGGVLLCVLSRWRVRAAGVIAACLAIWFLLPKAAREHGASVLVARGSSHRFEVWRETLRLIGQRPVFGHGLAANLHLSVGDPRNADRITFPHDLYLSLLFYSGAVGLALFAACAGLTARRLWPIRRGAEWPWLMALLTAMLAAGATDLGQITKGPGPLWFIVWLPLCLAMTAGRDASSPS